MTLNRSWVKPLLVALVTVGLLGGSVPSARALTPGTSGLAATVLALEMQQFDRSEFMEDTPDEIYRENRVNPWQAWALAFFPAALVKGITVSLAYVYSEKEAWAPYLPLVPIMGQSHFWETGVWWAGLIALGGDVISGALLTYYFSQVHDSTPTTRPDKTMLWAGVSVMAIFFVYENVSAPIIANWQNKRLRKQFKPASDDDTKTAFGSDPRWRLSPWPDTGSAQIGPAVRTHTPIGASYAFRF